MTSAACQFVAVSNGIADFVVSTAVAGKKTPVQAGAADGGTYEYYAWVGDQYERGRGTWNLASNTLFRTTVKDNSLNTLAKISFASPPTVEVYPTPAQTLEAGSSAFTATTAMLFQQTAAPVGWTKQTTHNDKALRVVSGTASSGGSNSFSSVMAQTVVGNHTNTTAEITSHAHSYSAPGATVVNLTQTCAGASAGGPAAGSTTGAQGSGSAHNHTILMSVQYVDMIIATKD